MRGIAYGVAFSGLLAILIVLPFAAPFIIAFFVIALYCAISDIWHWVRYRKYGGRARYNGYQTSDGIVVPTWPELDDLDRELIVANMRRGNHPLTMQEFESMVQQFGISPREISERVDKIQRIYARYGFFPDN